MYGHISDIVTKINQLIELYHKVRIVGQHLQVLLEPELFNVVQIELRVDVSPPLLALILLSAAALYHLNLFLQSINRQTIL